MRKILLLTIAMALLASTVVGSEIAHGSESLSVTALTTNAWMHYAEWFVILTTYPAIIMMLFISFSLHIGRPIVIRYLNRMTLRLGADLLWEAWIIGRDVLILLSVAFLAVLIQPRIMEEWFTIVLVPAFILGMITLLFKLIYDTDASKSKYMIATALTGLTLVAATVPYGIPSMWHDKGHERFETEFFIPISQQERAGMIATGNMMPQNMAPMVVDNLKHAIENTISAMEQANRDEAVKEAKEAKAHYTIIASQLAAWNIEKSQTLEHELDELIEASEQGDTTAAKKLQQEIDALLKEFENQVTG
jgi:hypothetical protein